jgi:hypothetical protein
VDGAAEGGGEDLGAGPGVQHGHPVVSDGLGAFAFVRKSGLTHTHPLFQAAPVEHTGLEWARYVDPHPMAREWAGAEKVEEELFLAGVFAHKLIVWRCIF